MNDDNDGQVMPNGKEVNALVVGHVVRVVMVTVIGIGQETRTPYHRTSCGITRMAIRVMTKVMTVMTKVMTER